MIQRNCLPRLCLGVSAIAAAAGLVVGIGAAPAFAVNGETPATLYSPQVWSGSEFKVPCDMDLKPSADSPEVKGSCHLWDKFAESEPVRDRDMGLAADSQIDGADLILPGQIDEPDETISATTSAHVACGIENGATVPFCLMAATTAGSIATTRRGIRVTRGGVGLLLIRNDGCESDCAVGGGPFSVSTDAAAIAEENAVLGLAYPEADWVEWMFGMDNEDIGDAGAYHVTLDEGLRSSLAANGSVPGGPVIAAVTVAPAELFAAVKTPGVYCTVNGVCVRY